MKNKVFYASMSNNNDDNSRFYDVSTSDIVLDLVELILVLFVRLEHPKQAKSLPVITKIPELLASIADEKKLAISQMGMSRKDVLKELNERKKEMYFAHMDKYNFTRAEKELAWLLVTANSTSECIDKLHTTEGQIRYATSKMCKKSGALSKTALVSLLRNEVEGE